MRIDLDAILVEPPGDDLLALDEALLALAREDPLGAELVQMRAFAGLTLAEAADAMGIGRRTADRYWAYARAGSVTLWAGATTPPCRPDPRNSSGPPGALRAETEH